MYKVYTRDNCSYCSAAKRLLEIRGAEYIEIKIDDNFTKEMLLEVVPHAKTVPQIFNDLQYIGGFVELEEHFKNNDPARYLIE